MIKLFHLVNMTKYIHRVPTFKTDPDESRNQNQLKKNKKFSGK